MAVNEKIYEFNSNIDVNIVNIYIVLLLITIDNDFLSVECLPVFSTGGVIYS